MKTFQISQKSSPEETLFTVEAPDMSTAIKMAMETKRLDFDAFMTLFYITEKSVLDERVTRSKNTNLLHG